MAPITDDTVNALRDTIDKLESRVKQLEARLGEGQEGSSANDRSIESIRMILMGPPGAGKTLCTKILVLLPLLTNINREGDASAKDQGQILRLPFGESMIC